MKTEKRYEFKRELLNIHKEGLRDKNLTKAPDEYELPDGLKIVIFEGASPVIKNAVKVG